MFGYSACTPHSPAYLILNLLLALLLLLLFALSSYVINSCANGSCERAAPKGKERSAWCAENLDFVEGFSPGPSVQEFVGAPPEVDHILRVGGWVSGWPGNCVFRGSLVQLVVVNGTHPGEAAHEYHEAVGAQVDEHEEPRPDV